MFHTLTIANLKRETADCVSLAFTVPDHLRAAFAFAPGQYLTLRATIDGEEVRRSYSICTAPADGELRVAIKHVADGVFSHFANTRLATGDTLAVMPPEGRFGAPLAEGTTLAIAAGSGITPILAILKATLAASPTANCVLLYGSRTVADIIFRTELEDLKDRHLGRLAVTHILSREAQDVAVLNGRIDAAKLRALLPTLITPAAVDLAYLCGPGALIDTATATLFALGVAPARIRAERFTPSTPSRPRPAIPAGGAEAPFATATIIHDGKSNDIPVAAGEPILEAAIRAGLDLPWSCRGGMCSTCRARLTEGAATMEQNFSLEPWETDAGYVLTCQAHPTTPHVTVDYDQV
ncbi:MAG: 2Fe-2S iron-sulfur cluster-binding protein [Alphaproteobacteria bacterium]|nr:2Fe-2S iron-sulfur cluster-binding protein [Alphaproteobacteria bacterium]